MKMPETTRALAIVNQPVEGEYQPGTIDADTAREYAGAAAAAGRHAEARLHLHAAEILQGRENGRRRRVAVPDEATLWMSYDGTVRADVCYHENGMGVSIGSWSSARPGEGNTRRALAQLPSELGNGAVIVADGIGNSPADPSWQYWEKMFDERLVDELLDDQKCVVREHRRDIARVLPAAELGAAGLELR